MELIGLFSLVRLIELFATIRIILKDSFNRSTIINNNLI